MTKAKQNLARSQQLSQRDRDTTSGCSRADFQIQIGNISRTSFGTSSYEIQRKVLTLVSDLLIPLGYFFDFLGVLHLEITQSENRDADITSIFCKVMYSRRGQKSSLKSFMPVSVKLERTVSRVLMPHRDNDVSSGKRRRRETRCSSSNAEPFSDKWEIEALERYIEPNMLGVIGQ
ncbi:hypothetical protein SCHPADRAFT_932322 [Schizopora paradoxa]|uniref:Uncharacterized protein n=1 Tax=Schizopora paradoxa TaxID=27342 RepID=A0A0H2R6X1_9AGAM|nr:hypothetical protein SCHPADRAFT_932322 [Schizopora paradoxa]